MSQDEFNQKVIEHLIALGERLESIERMLGAESKRFLSESAIPSPGMILIEDEPEWRPMSTAPRECKCIKVKHAKTGEEYFASFFYDGWSCSLSRYKPDNTFLFFDSQLSGWRHL